MDLPNLLRYILLGWIQVFDGNNTLIFEVGYVTGSTMTPVLIGADEQIICGKAKVYSYRGTTYQAVYTDL